MSESAARHLWWGIGLTVASLMLGVAVSAGAFRSFDTSILKSVALAGSASGDLSVMAARGLTRLGDASLRGFAIIILLGALIYRINWRSAAVFLLTVAMSITGHSVAKEVFGRARPTLVPALDRVDTYAFPSGHAAAAMVVLLLGTLMLGGRRTLLAALLLALAIGLSRVVLGVHWPSDVIGGWLFGGGTALIGYAMAHQFLPRQESKH